MSKITRNQQRNLNVWRQLEAKGWSIIIIWECELKTIRLQKTIDMTVAAIRQNGENQRQAQNSKRLIREKYHQQRKQQKVFEAIFIYRRDIEVIPQKLTPSFQPLSIHDDG